MRPPPARPFLLAPLFLFASAAAPVDHPRDYLASIRIDLKDDEYVDRFSIDTWGVTFKAVCHIPPGWRIKAGGSAAPDGIIAGEASHGVTFLDRKRIGQLRGLVLLTLYGPVQRDEVKDGDGVVPATFAGQADVGRYGGDDGEGRQAPLGAANILLVPASRCPAPHA
jgi:hypothetical protein